MIAGQHDESCNKLISLPTKEALYLLPVMSQSNELGRILSKNTRSCTACVACLGARAISLSVVNEAFLLRIEGYFASQLPADRGSEAGHVAVANCGGIANRLLPSFNAIEEVADMHDRIRTGNLIVFFIFDQLRVAGYDLLGVPGFYPAFIAFEANGASTESFLPIASPSKPERRITSLAPLAY